MNNFFAQIWYSVVLDKRYKKKGAIRNGIEIRRAVDGGGGVTRKSANVVNLRYIEKNA